VGRVLGHFAVTNLFDSEKIASEIPLPPLPKEAKKLQELILGKAMSSFTILGLIFIIGDEGYVVQPTAAGK
jgi:hypothetical protein